MAAFSATVSCVTLLSSLGATWRDTFMVSQAVSNMEEFQIVLAAGTSAKSVSFQTVTNGSFLIMRTNGACRVNFMGLPSMVSAASAGWTFGPLFAQCGSGGSGWVGLNFANSGTDSATITGIVAM